MADTILINEIKPDLPLPESAPKQATYSGFSFNIDAYGNPLPTNALTSPADSGIANYTTGTIAANSDVATSTGAGTNTDTTVTHNLNRKPKRITIYCQITAKGDAAGDNRRLSGHFITDTDGTILTSSKISRRNRTPITADDVDADTLASFQAASFSGGANGETITISIPTVTTTTFTFRINGELNGTDPGASTVTNITWIVEG